MAGCCVGQFSRMFEPLFEHSCRYHVITERHEAGHHCFRLMVAPVRLVLSAQEPSWDGTVNLKSKYSDEARHVEPLFFQLCNNSSRHQCGECRCKMMQVVPAPMQRIQGSFPSKRHIKHIEFWSILVQLDCFTDRRGLLFSSLTLALPTWRHTELSYLPYFQPEDARGFIDFEDLMILIDFDRLLWRSSLPMICFFGNSLALYTFMYISGHPPTEAV